jgi:DNA-binding CsgD family transcriptional regulator
MTGFKTAIITPNYLVARGLSYYIHQMVPDPRIDFYHRMPSIQKNAASDYFVVFIDLLSLSPPIVYTVEKLYKTLKGVRLVSVSENEPECNIMPFFHQIIHFEHTEEEIQEKIRSIYLIEEDNIPKHNSHSILSIREKEILRCIALGQTNKAISDQLSISTHTVITHRKNITAKLGIKTIAGLTIYAIINGIISAKKMDL